MSKELESKVEEVIIKSAPNKESADIAKSMIDSGKIVIMGVSF